MNKAMGTTLEIVRSGGNIKIGAVRAVSELKMDSEMLETTTLDAPDGFKTYTQGARDAGEVTISGYLTEDDGQAALRAAYQSGEMTHFLLSFTGGMTASFDALVRAVSLRGVAVDSVLEYEITLRLSGQVVIA